MSERITGAGDKIRALVANVRLGAQKDDVFGAYGPYLGIKYEYYEMSPEEEASPEGSNVQAQHGITSERMSENELLKDNHERENPYAR